jgi:putative addiction module component
VASPDDILSSALLLPEEARADIALRLLDSLGDRAARSEEEWIEDIERRARRVLAGETRGSSWDDVRARIESALKK